jgi:hypothetical protein
VKTTIKYIAPCLAAAALGAAIGLASVANADPGSTPVSQPKVAANLPAALAQAPFVSDEDPLVPNSPGADPDVTPGPDPSVANPDTGYVNSNHDEVNTSVGESDVPS